MTDPELHTLFHILFGEPLRGTDTIDPRLKTPCSPHESVRGTGYHVHLCQCGTAWKHDDMLPAIVGSSAEFTEAHTCDNCGNEVRDKHYA